MPDSLRTANDRCNTSRPERVAASGVGETGGQRSPFYHPQHISSRHCIFRKLSMLVHTPEERSCESGWHRRMISSWNFFPLYGGRDGALFTIFSTKDVFFDTSRRSYV